MRRIPMLISNSSVLASVAAPPTSAGSPYTSDANGAVKSNVPAGAGRPMRRDVGGYRCKQTGTGNGATGGDASSMVAPGFGVEAKSASCANGF